MTIRVCEANDRGECDRSKCEGSQTDSVNQRPSANLRPQRQIPKVTASIVKDTIGTRVPLCQKSYME